LSAAGAEKAESGRRLSRVLDNLLGKKTAQLAGGEDFVPLGR
jgi:hypothetical protein